MFKSYTKWLRLLQTLNMFRAFQTIIAVDASRRLKKNHRNTCCFRVYFQLKF